YIADNVPDKHLLASVGDIQRYQTIAWFNFVATELHKTFGPLFHPASQDVKQNAIQTLKRKFDYVEQHLSSTDYLMGEHFTIADAYLFVVSRWRKGLGLPTYPALEAF